MAIEIPRAEKAPQEGFLHEGERRGRGKGVAARVGAAEIAAMGKGSAQEGRPSGTASQPQPSHRNIPSECSDVAHGLLYDFAPSFMRTLVFRSAYSTSRNARALAASRPPWEPHCGLLSKTLMLQVHCGCRNVREGDAVENGGEERRKVVEIMTCL